MWIKMVTIERFCNQKTVNSESGRRQIFVQARKIFVWDPYRFESSPKWGLRTFSVRSDGEGNFQSKKVSTRNDSGDHKVNFFLLATIHKVTRSILSAIFSVLYGLSVQMSVGTNCPAGFRYLQIVPCTNFFFELLRIAVAKPRSVCNFFSRSEASEKTNICRGWEVAKPH